MQNISYVCVLMGRAWVSGLKPAKNVGAQNASIIERLICELDGQPFSGQAEFEHQVIQYKEKPISPSSPGIEEPSQRYLATTSYVRDPTSKPGYSSSQTRSVSVVMHRPVYHGYRRTLSRGASPAHFG